MPGRPVPRDDVQRASGTRSRTSATRSGTASRSSPASASRTSRSASRASRTWGEDHRGPRPARSAPPAAACGCGASTCRTAARSPTRTTSTSSSGWPRCGRRPPAGWPRTRRRRSPWSATGTSRPQDDDVWDMARLRPLHARLRRPSGRPSGPSSTPGSPTSSGRTRPGPGVYTYWDYTQLRFPRREGMRIDFVLGSPALAGRVDRRAASTARSARARAPATTPP